MVMGIINCTPDSFYPGSRRPETEAAVRTALAMVDDGAGIIDVGGESTRPGSEFVDQAEEAARVVPVIRGIREESDVLISVDTRKSGVAREALDAGADIVNDVSGLRDDPELAALVAERNVPVVIMHMRETPKTMQVDPYFRDVVREVRDELMERVGSALDAGISRNRIIIDPGIGFGKRLEDNLSLLKNVPALRELGFPVLIGASRKSFIDKILRRPVEDRLPATLAVEAFAVMGGAEIVRVHDVRETVDMVRILGAIRGA